MAAGLSTKESRRAQKYTSQRNSILVSCAFPILKELELDIVHSTKSCAQTTLLVVPDYRLLNQENGSLMRSQMSKDLGDDLILFRFNEVKTLEWLSAKVTRTAIHFMKQRQEKMDTENVAFVSTFQSSSHATVNLKSNTTETTLSEPNSHDIKTAIQVVTDYLSESMTEKLLKAFGLSAADLTDTKNHSSKRKTDWEADLEVLKTVAFACVFCSTMSSHIRLRSV